MIRRTLTTSALLSLWLPAVASAAPNVVVIVADDLGWADTTLNVSDGVPTPRLDGLASEGVRFTSAYVVAPSCGPSRAGMLTGRYPQRFGFEFNPGNVANPQIGLPTSETTLAEVMQGAGYTTGLVGKWHLGTGAAYPTRNGFDEFYGLLVGETPYIDVSLPGVHMGVLGEGLDTTTRSAATQIVRGDPPVVVHNFDTYLTDDLATQAVQFVDRHAAQEAPFFLWLGFTAPHAPFQVTSEYYDRFPDIADENERIYAGMISALDDGVGEVLDALEDAGVAEDTIVVFLSDNGCATYTGVCSCDPVRGGKFSHLEGGVRVPMVIRWPKGLPAGVVDDAVVSAMDVFATAATAAGVTPVVVDGVDLVPFVEGTAPGQPHRELFWRSGSQHAARLDNAKLWSRPEATELFNLPLDPLELTDVSAALPTVRVAVERRYAAWERQMVPAAWAPPSSDFEQCGDTVSYP